MEQSIKKKILFVNSVCYGSTGKICKDLYDLAEDHGYECCIAYGRGKAPKEYKTIKIGNQLDIYSHVVKTRLFDSHGFGSKNATKKFLKQLDNFKPDIIHLHNIHGYYINIEILFNYLKKHNEIKIIWTLHDCWAFTGHCAYYIYSQCEKWKNDCKQCNYYKEYPKSKKCNSSDNFINKKSIFSGLSNMTIVTPSDWLNEEVSSSFLRNYPIKVIHNGISIDNFKYTNLQLKDKYNLKDKKLILGVASIWDNRKGLNDFLELSKYLNGEYHIVLVGLNDKQQKELPKNILGIQRTENIDELASWYSEADILFNPTLEDNYPTVDLEAQACGTPVLAYDSGGTKETLFSTSKIVKDVNDFLENLDCINEMKKNYEIHTDKLDAKLLFKQYIDLYDELIQ